MSSIVTDQGLLHYETIGRGQPIILLHGWINSWEVWRESMIALSKTRKFRVYTLDFWGFGDSAKNSRPASSNPAASDPYRVNSYVEMVNQFMDALGIPAAPVIGHSMGGTVALQLALTHPDRVQKVAAIGSPVIGNSLNPFLQLAGYGSIARLIWHYPILLQTIMRILLAKDSKEVRTMIFRDVQRTTMESFFRSIGDLRDTNLIDQLPALNMPTMGIYGKNDNIVSPNNANLLREAVPTSQVHIMSKSRHFPMTDEPELFLETLQSFLNDDGMKSRVDAIQDEKA